jgi:hypothetical protein
LSKLNRANFDQGHENVSKDEVKAILGRPGPDSAHLHVGKEYQVMFFAFKWIHGDGSIIEFSPEGWHSGDRTKMDWLNEESAKFTGWPIIPSTVLDWLRGNCELIEFRGVTVDVDGKAGLSN